MEMESISMMMRSNRSIPRGLATAIAVLGLCGFLSTKSFAGSTFSFTGSFTQDNDVQLFTFTINSPTTVSMETWSYAGGVNAAGATIPRGGFDPIVSLFSGNGTFIALNDDGPTATVDPVTGVAYDSQLTQSLAAGKYFVALTQFDNFPIKNLGDGFTEDGNTNFTLQFAPPGSTGFFWDITPNQRTGNWALDIGPVDGAQLGGGVPEPSSVVLGGISALALAGLQYIRRRRLAAA
jgi:hypothetical protein